MYGESFFVDRKQMSSVYELSSVSNLPETAYDHFMNHENEILYLLDEGRLSGILSIGDLERFFAEQAGELKINQRYTSVDAVDYDRAAVFLDDSVTVNEVPVVTGQGDLLGIIRREKPQYLKELQRTSLKAARTGEYAWRKEEIRRFIKRTKSNVFLYTYLSEQFDEKNKRRLKERRRNLDKSIWEILSDQEWKCFLGSEDGSAGSDLLREESAGCVLTFTNGRAAYSDMEGKYYTIRNGYRFTPGNPLDADRRIFMFGPCTVFGAYCRDDQTIEAYLQKLFNSNGYTSWEVLNRGLCGGTFCYDQMFLEELSENDIAIILCIDIWKPDGIDPEVAFCGDLAEVLMRIPDVADCLLDSVQHCNYIVNGKIAEQIYSDICASDILNRPLKQGISERIQDYYINWPIREYFTEYFKQYGIYRAEENIRVGAVVMNCNPFTKGHRYLIEEALKMVDDLYIFVVEEDQSYFKFQDRLQMVEQGVSDLIGVRVVPSGRYILSKDTFAQYFEKEQVRTVESMDYDIYIFGEVVAAGLGIQYRFVGEEPFDQVTREYNETMKRILPDFGVTVVEIPRVTVEENGKTVVSATSVRKALQEKDMGTIEKLCPESTVMYLKERLG